MAERCTDPSCEQHRPAGGEKVVLYETGKGMSVMDFARALDALRKPAHVARPAATDE